MAFLDPIPSTPDFSSCITSNSKSSLATPNSLHASIVASVTVFPSNSLPIDIIMLLASS